MAEITPVPSATVLLVRDAADGFEVLMMERNAKSVFVPGMYVFPGGAIDDEDHAADVQALAASWVLSAEGVAMLLHWHDEATTGWLAAARAQLRIWTAAQRAMLTALGWQQSVSDTPFWLACPAQDLACLRAVGIKLRDAGSFGRPGWVRVATLSPTSQQALLKALQP